MGGYHRARSASLDEIDGLSVTTIVCHSETEFQDFSVEPEKKVINLGCRRGASFAEISTKIEQHLEKLCPDVVFVLGWSMPSGLATLEWCVSRGVRSVMMSESNKDDAPRSIAKEFIKRQIVSLTDAGFVGGRLAAEYMAELRMPRELISLGYNAVDNQHFAEGARQARANEEACRMRYSLPEKYILCCARLVEKKNHIRLIEAYAMATQTSRDDVPSLLFVGPGPLEDSIRRKISSLGLTDRVILKGSYGYSDLPAVYALAEALILPSTSEQWGLVVNEAMAAGLPILVSKKCGSAYDLVEHNNNGYTFDPFDVSSIAQALVWFSKNSSSERIAMGARSEVIIKRWGLDRFAAGFRDCVKNALSADRPKRSSLARAMIRVASLK
jgi:glycosyltransferase involved in cell wall biosynthesis